MTHTAIDKHHMQSALTLSRWGLGQVMPNPSVGCVIVDRDGYVVGHGRTAHGGRPHGETIALEMAGDKSACATFVGSTAYVTLEPCSHHGQTPPCAQALIDAGVSRVVVACLDPDSRVAGRGVALLRDAGITVDVGCLGHDAVAVHAGFFSKILRNRPWVTVKIATTMDGKIALAGGDSQWITGDTARDYGQQMRAQNDAILVGAGTVRADNPRLNCRVAGLSQSGLPQSGLSQFGLSHDFIRVVVGDISTVTKDAHICDGSTLTYNLTTQDKPMQGIETIVCPSTANNRVDLQFGMQALAEQGITRLMVEGGGTVLASLLSANLIDEIHWIHAPSVIGGDGLPSLADLGLLSMVDIPRFDVAQSRPLRHDRLTILRSKGALDFAHHLSQESP